MVGDGSRLMNRSKWHMSFDLLEHTVCASFLKSEIFIVP